jgi:hypothetical protein
MANHKTGNIAPPPALWESRSDGVKEQPLRGILPVDGNRVSGWRDRSLIDVFGAPEHSVC